MLLSEGASPSSVIDGLDDMIRRMQQIPSGWARPDSWALVQNSYLQLVETLDQALSSWFEDDDGARVGAAWRALQADPRHDCLDAAPISLINDEAARQVSVLERLRAKVTALESLSGREGQIAVLDTTVLMHYQRLDEIVWVEVLGASPHTATIPRRKRPGAEQMSGSMNR